MSAQESHGWITPGEACALTGLAMRSIYRLMKREWVTKYEHPVLSNGRKMRLIAVDSLPRPAKELYWLRRAKASVATALRESDVPGLSYSDLRVGSVGHHG